MQLNTGNNRVSNRKKKAAQEYFRYMIFTGLLLAAGITALKSLEYYYFSYMITSEFYIGIIAVIFLGLGVFVGLKFKNKRVSEKSASSPVELPNNIELSSREMEVLKMIASGCSNQEIADQLFVTINTIKSHTNNIYSKLNVKRRTQAIETARKLKIIQ